MSKAKKPAVIFISYEYVVGLCITMDTDHLKLVKALSLREKKHKNDDNAI